VMRKAKTFARAFAVLLLIILALPTGFITIFGVQGKPSTTTASTNADSGKSKNLDIPPALKDKLPPELIDGIKRLQEIVNSIRQGDNYVKGERIVAFKPSTPKSKIAEITASVGAASVKHLATLSVKGVETEVKLLKFSSEEKAREAEAALKKDPNVLYVAKNFKVYAPPVEHRKLEGNINGNAEVSPSGKTADPYLSYQWYLDKIGYDLAPFPLSAPVVAVVDTGVQYDHPELSGKVILGHDYVDDDNDPYDENGHGTAVAGVIAAKANNGIGIAGVSPSSRIYAVRVLDAYGYGEFEWVMQGILEAADNPDVKVINLSLGGYVWYGSDEYNLMESVINYAVYQKGKIVVAAAGNADNLITYIYDNASTPYYDLVPVPAAVPSCLTVAATDELDVKTFFSNYGTNTLNYVDLAAPGYRILTLYLGSGLAVWPGTSFSAPIVSGVAARVWAAHPDWSNTQVMQQLVATGRPLGPDKGFPVTTRRVDLAKALGVAATGIRGQIVDAENPNPFFDTLGGVRVEVTGPSKNYTYSKNGGFFTITNLAPGTYTVKVSKSGYVTQTAQVTVTAGSITEDVNFYMVRVKPTTYVTVVTTWKAAMLGIYELWYNFFYGLEHPDLPRWYRTAGAEMNANLRILPDGVRVYWRNPGSLTAPPYAVLVVNSLWIGRPVETIVYIPQQGKTYSYGLGMSPYDGCWGTVAASGAVTNVYKGASIVQTISPAKATGTSDFWWYVYDQKGTGGVGVVNKRTPMFGVEVQGSSPTILLVDDDASPWRRDYSGYFKSALGDAGYSYVYWDEFEAGPPSAGDLSRYATVVWFTGDDWRTTLTQYEREALAGFLSSGSKGLFITGQDIGYYLNEHAWWSAYAPSPDAASWYENWLRAQYLCDDATWCGAALALAGVPGDPVSDGMMLAISGGDGADNQLWPDAIIPAGNSTPVFFYLDSDGNPLEIAGGVRFPAPVPAPPAPYRLVYLSFGFEAISDAGDRAQLMDNIIRFLKTGS